MLHARNRPMEAGVWDDASRGALPSSWSRRQPIPGAVKPTGHTAGVLTGLSPRDNLYAIALDITATGPGGGYAAEQLVTYESGGSTYELAVHSGIAIGSVLIPIQDSCSSSFNILKKSGFP
jgi:hypothetical protein